jgi:stress-induced morphogen
LALRIVNAGPEPELIIGQIREAIESAIAGARAEVRCASPGHFEIRVASEAFAGKPKVRQHQMVYGAITPLMSGDAPPVHAVDHLECVIPA